ncbi:hypothetical protein [Salmonirosea aquatica]|uniref:Succinate dehydrogenase n=1 Tax=Salmonirosea aquatica TaxID=2654236 RepID=A0A7C9FF44_9BACT|nr:hypothetical protein [Cytophagaceae bacterium SJW1-29]
MRLKTIHRISGIFIALYVVAHLVNHLASLWGPEAHIRLMDALRPSYRNVLVETVLLAAIGMQIYSGTRLFLADRKTAMGFFEKLQHWTGLYLAFFFVVHLSAVMVGRHALHLDTNIYFGAAGLNSFPLNLFFIPYYGLSILSFFGHLAALHTRKMSTKVLGISPKQQSYGIMMLGLLAAFLILFGLTGYFRGLQMP